jgi:two-component system KDP operon response regulator KdpE
MKSISIINFNPHEPQESFGFSISARPLLTGKNRMLILIVEPEKTLQISLALFLGSQKNCQVLTADSKKEGVALWGAFPCDLVICSDRLADGAGLEMLKEFSRQDPKVISILMTARSDEGLRQEALQAGIKAYLEKPFDLQQLEEAMGFIRP